MKLVSVRPCGRGSLLTTSLARLAPKRSFRELWVLVSAVLVSSAFIAMTADVAAAIDPPTAAWSFDDGSNPTMDETGNGNDGTLFGAPVYSGDVPAQIGSGNSLSFNGTSHYIALNMFMSGAGSLPQLSASAWFKTDFSAAGNFTNWSFLDFDRSEFFNVYITGNGRIGFSSTASNGTRSDMFSATSGLHDNAWHHVAVVYDGVDKSIYIDGVLDSKVVNAHGGAALGRVNVTRWGFIGDGSEAVSFNGARNNVLYDGFMDEVAFWDVPLSAADILAIAGGASVIGPPDSDGDGVPDDDDLCPGGDDNQDTDGDNVADYCDPCPNDSQNDADGDGVCGDIDVCPGGDDNQNTDGDALPDFCDICPLDVENDADGDGVCETDDNCPTVANNNQSDLDGDDIGDACDPDIDGDGVDNADDNCMFDVNTDQADFDGDGAGDVCDNDVDGDGVLDAFDACVPTAVGAPVDVAGCSIAQLCPCEHPSGAAKWKNHGAYVSCVAHASEDFVDAGLITEAEKDAIVSEAGGATCGHKNK